MVIRDGDIGNATAKERAYFLWAVLYVTGHSLMYRLTAPNIERKKEQLRGVVVFAASQGNRGMRACTFDRPLGVLYLAG